MIYKCSHCRLLGSGIPPKSYCPNCGNDLEIKIRSNGEDVLDGDYLTIAAAADEVIQIVRTFSHTKSQLYVSSDIDAFLKMYFPNEVHNYIVDTKLLNFQMEVK